MSDQRRSGEHDRRVQELRRSNAAGAHGVGKYSRRSKYPNDWIQEACDDGSFDEED